jgi:hypothetical protein
MADKTPDEILQSTAETVEILKDAIISLGSIIQSSLNKNLTDADDYTKLYVKNVKSSVSSLMTSLKKSGDQLILNQLKLNKGQLTAKDISKQITELESKKIILLNQIITVRKNEYIESDLARKLYDQINESINEGIVGLKEQKNQAKKINENLGSIGHSFKIISGILKKVGIDSAVLDSINERIGEQAAKNTLTYKRFAAIVKSELKESLENPLIRASIGLKLIQSGFNSIKSGLSAFKDFNINTTSIARSLGLAQENIREFTRDIIATQGNLGASTFSAKQLEQALQESNEQLGTSLNLSKDTVYEFAQMTQNMGLSANEAGRIYSLSLLNGKTLKDTNRTIAASITAVEKQTGVQLNAKQIFQEIGKLNAGITAKFQQNIPALAAAVAQAKALGTNLEQVDKIGESLLNFESSIESQLKAQLITGKAINLEKARYAALTGDQVTLTREITNQVGSLSEFQNMNVIAQKSLAEAFGMSRDELAEMLKQQEVFTKLGDISGKTAQEQLKIAKERGLSDSDSLVMNLQQQAATEKISIAFDNIKSTIASLVDGPLGSMVKFMANMLNSVGGIATILIISVVSSIGKMIIGFAQLVAAAKLLKAEETKIAIAKAAQLAFLNPVAAIVGGVILTGLTAALISAVNAPQFATGGIVTSEINNATIGEAGPEAIIPLNSPRAKNLFGGGGTEIVDAIKDAITSGFANQRDPQFSLIVDGEPLGTVVGNQYTTSNRMRQNSHSFA